MGSFLFAFVGPTILFTTNRWAPASLFGVCLLLSLVVARLSVRSSLSSAVACCLALPLCIFVASFASPIRSVLHKRSAPGGNLVESAPDRCREGRLLSQSSAPVASERSPCPRQYSVG